MIHKAAIGGWLLLAPFACAPKEAENPRTLLGEDLSHEGVYGGGASPDTPGASPGDDPPASGKSDARDPGALATRAECEAAAKHLVALGIELAIREETDEERKAQLARDREAARGSERARAHVATWTRECLETGTTVREARCIARIRNERDIDACVGGR
jgi:hypothetical protein